MTGVSVLFRLDIGDIARSKKTVLEDETRKGHGFLSFKRMAPPIKEEQQMEKSLTELFMSQQAWDEQDIFKEEKTLVTVAPAGKDTEKNWFYGAWRAGRPSHPWIDGQ